MPPSLRMMRALRRCHGRPVRFGMASPSGSTVPSMAEREENVIAPPPRGQGLGHGPGQAQEQRPALQVPPNDAKQLIRQGFWLGVGIWLAFAAISAVVWLIAAAFVAAVFAS